MSGSREAREPSSPLERETKERDVHPEEEGRSKPDTSGETTDQALKHRSESEKGAG
ncbi:MULTISPECIES: hypothetical protein [Streptomyces]|jgi:hypothetical protein|uniref:hypothetical protein n=1 Tax=Streptomyces TaxID=1883 RepID=UPI00163CD32A|nr:MULTISPECIES: hypothetical protein [Streptomyces]MCM3262824.1 hypothetical protein [Streptomyces thermoviolaceus]WTD50126.1 hypothetical protein OG899_22970 [Streptomyces thermoviolaceus]GGV65056.1 hypothetical protein GCM10010499_09240 [Streptomyces thermoviolaceus subsp. apingens]GHB00320.1 hypothetical protein GCM10010512_34770 [Streptomyces thermoviolaceus subsp. thermoviolaceus]